MHKFRRRKLIRPLTLLLGLAISALLASVAVTARGALEATHFPPLVQADNPPNTDAAERLLSQRGLMGQPRASTRAIPPRGTEVYETVETSTAGEVMSHTKSWSEPLDGDRLWIELTDFPSRQYQVSFWLLAGKGRGCALFGRTMFSHGGRRLQSQFWRNDRALKITGAADFPSDLYPSALPASALPRALDSLHAGAQGTLNQQITPYGYVNQKVSVEKTVRLKVPAGEFSACQINSQADVGRLLPNWPHMLLRLVSAFITATTYY